MPLAQAIIDALSTWFELDVSIAFERSQYRDHRTLSRALAGYVQAGYSLPDAQALLGLD